MFKLKSLFPIISFEENCIKLAVFEKSEHKPHELFYKKINVNYDNTFANIINLSHVKQTIHELVKSADKFLGFNLNFYYLMLPNLKTEVVCKTTTQFKVLNGLCSIQLKKNYESKIALSNLNEQTERIAFAIKEWNLNDVSYKNYPTNLTGDRLSISYVSYECDNIVLQQIKKIFSEININVNKIVTNTIIYTNRDILYINDNYVCYYKNNKVEQFEISLKDVCKKISDLVSVPVDKLVSFLYLTHKVNVPIPLVNIYDEKYMSFTEVNQFVLTKLFNKFITEMMNTISSQVDINNIIIKGNDLFYSLANSKINFKSSNLSLNTAINVENNYGLIKDENLVSLLDCLDYVSNVNELPFNGVLTEFNGLNLLEKAWLSNIMLKIGIITTQSAAKLK